MPTEFLPLPTETDGFIKLTEDGRLWKKVLKAGGEEPSAANKPVRGAQVRVHYDGTLWTAGREPFDSSRARGQPFAFKLGVGQVIRGWDEGIASLAMGETALLVCAPDYAYGPAGSPPTIPANATLAFEVELLDWFKEPETMAERLAAAGEEKQKGNALYSQAIQKDSEATQSRAALAGATAAYERGIGFLQQGAWSSASDADQAAKTELLYTLRSNLMAACNRAGDWARTVATGQAVLSGGDAVAAARLRADPKALFRYAQGLRRTGALDEAQGLLVPALAALEGTRGEAELAALRQELAEIDKARNAEAQRQAGLYAKMSKAFFA